MSMKVHVSVLDFINGHAKCKLVVKNMNHEYKIAMNTGKLLLEPLTLYHTIPTF